MPHIATMFVNDIVFFGFMSCTHAANSFVRGVDLPTVPLPFPNFICPKLNHLQHIMSLNKSNEYTSW